MIVICSLVFPDPIPAFPCEGKGKMLEAGFVMEESGVSKHTPQRLGDLLLDSNLIDEIQLRVALQEQGNTGERLGSALVHLGFIDEAVLAAFLSKQAELPCVNIQGLHIPSEILELIPKEIAVKNAVIPVRLSGITLYVAMSDPFDSDTLDIIADVTGMEIMPLIAPEFRLKKSLERFYGEEIEEERPEAVSAELSTLVQELEKDTMENMSGRIDALSGKIDLLTATLEEIKIVLTLK